MKTITENFLVFSVASALFYNSAYAGSKPVVVGDFHSRGLISKPQNASPEHPAPALILIPGSGEFGPEEMLPKVLPPAGSDGYPYLSLFAQEFQKAGFHTLQLGKPGVEYFTHWESFLRHENFYDLALWNRLTWSDMITNVQAAVELLRQDPTVAKDKIYILGHSEGTITATDAAAADPKIAGVILLGYCGEAISSVVRWQILERQFDLVIKPDIDADHDGYITEQEANVWPKSTLFPPSFLSSEHSWNWTVEPKIALSKIKNLWLSDSQLTPLLEYKMWTDRFPFWRGDFWNRTDIKQTTASILGRIIAFTGEYDINTPVSYALSLKQQCAVAGKQDCEVNILAGLTHRFAPINDVPLGAKLNMVVDQGNNPPAEILFAKLRALAETLKQLRLISCHKPCFIALDTLGDPDFDQSLPINAEPSCF